ncbi:LADA_0H03356g1_1 [Lachancea dasiensis]|uniref:LADA_0H03356g1_1 n=1 Tax=Lachancea dasiensis TaxID=1072105 RepID=A0A1G4K0A4_9SACH|nr:LADA_0H03356g1_1 [Lachancea dasiensis]
MGLIDIDRKRIHDQTAPKSERHVLVARKPKRMKPTQAVSHLEAFLSTTSHEMIMQIVRLLDRRDLIYLSCSNKRVRSRILPYIFDEVKCSWRQLMHEWKTKTRGVCAPIEHPELVQHLRISSPCSKNEWAFPFHVLFDKDSAMVNLISLTLPTSGSANFFKYCNSTTRLLRLRLDAERSDSSFSLEHVRVFPALRDLTLSNFRIDPQENEEEDQCPDLKTFTLINCTWCYPFNLENLGRDKITSLHLVYSNSFIISERFKYFLSHPRFNNLTELSILNNEKNLRLTMSLKIMTLIRAMPTLKVLKLAGNIHNETLSRAAHSNNPNRTEVMAVQDVKVLYSRFLLDIS